MGRYFNDDMLEEQNEDYDAYIEHYGIPKDKWDPQIRARYEQLHHKTADALRKNGIGHDNRSGFQKAGDYFTKKKVRGVGFNRKKGLYLKRSTDFQNDIHNTARKANILPRPSQKFIRKMGGSSKTFTDFYGKKRVRGITAGKNGIHLKRTTDFQNSIEKVGKSIKKEAKRYDKGARRIINNGKRTEKAYSKFGKKINRLPNASQKLIRKTGGKSKTFTDFYGKKRIRGIGYSKKKGIYLKKSTDFEHAVGKGVNSVKKRYRKLVGNNDHRGTNDNQLGVSRKLQGVNRKAKEKIQRAGRAAKEVAGTIGNEAKRKVKHAKWDINYAMNRHNMRPDRTQADYERDKQLKSNLRQSVSRGTQTANANAERAQRERNRRRYGLNTADQERRKGQAANRRRARRNTV